MLRSALVAAAILAFPAFAEDACPCGMGAAECAKPGCTCGSGQCALHQGMKMGPGMGKMHGMPVFDPKTVATFTATVVDVERETHGKGMVGVHLKVKSGAELIVVHLGPADFVDPKATFAKGDQVEVTGSRIMFKDVATVLATKVARGAVVIEPRAADGTPNFKMPRG